MYRSGLGMPSAGDPFIGKRIAGKYEIKQLLGEGRRLIVADLEAAAGAECGAGGVEIVERGPLLPETANSASAS